MDDCKEGHRDYNSPVISNHQKASLKPRCFLLTPKRARGLSSPGKAPYMDCKEGHRDYNSPVISLIGNRKHCTEMWCFFVLSAVHPLTTAF